MPVLAVNLYNFSPTQYLNFVFDEAVAFQGNVIMSDNSSTYLHGDSDTDADSTDIDATFSLPTSDFTIPNLKHPRFLTFGAELSDDMQIDIEVDEDVTYTYFLYCTNQNQLMHNHKVDVGENCDGRYFKITASNMNGGDFSVNSINGLFIVRHTNSSP